MRRCRVKIAGLFAGATRIAQRQRAHEPVGRVIRYANEGGGSIVHATLGLFHLRHAQSGNPCVGRRSKAALVSR